RPNIRSPSRTNAAWAGLSRANARVPDRLRPRGRPMASMSVRAWVPPATSKSAWATSSVRTMSAAAKIRYATRAPACLFAACKRHAATADPRSAAAVNNARRSPKEISHPKIVMPRYDDNTFCRLVIGGDGWESKERRFRQFAGGDEGQFKSEARHVSL